MNSVWGVLNRINIRLPSIISRIRNAGAESED